MTQHDATPQAMPAPPPGFDPEGGGFIVPTFPVFTMPRSWTGPALSLAAVGLLARVQAAGDGSFNLVDLAGSRELAEAIGAELVATGILVGGKLTDPDEDRRRSERAAEPRPKPYAPDPGVVYYALRVADGAVKIGHTRVKLKTRLRGLVRTFGAIDVLATEPGSLAKETARHDQFAQLRMPDQGGAGGTEFFRTAPVLVRHIEALRAAAVAA